MCHLGRRPIRADWEILFNKFYCDLRYPPHRTGKPLNWKFNTFGNAKITTDPELLALSS